MFIDWGHVDDVACRGRCRIDWNEDTPMFSDKIRQYGSEKLMYL